jgi:hypothetical protein
MRPALLLTFALGGLLAFACGTDAVGVETCRRVEEARCRRVADACTTSVDLSKPAHRDADVDACIRYYDTACLHGLVTATEPGGLQADRCIEALGRASCDDILHPERLSECSWLNPILPPAGGTDAGAPFADASDGG